MPDFLQLDAQALRDFRDHDVAEFMKELKRIRRPDWAPSLWGLLNGSERADGAEEQDALLVVGQMSEGGPVAGGPLLAEVRTYAQEIDDLVEQNDTLFLRISDSLSDTLTNLLDTQGSNLQAIETADYLEYLDGVEEVLTSTNSATSDLPNDSDAPGESDDDSA
ncbi:type VII secretion system-associated protein [Streptomyces sp. NPDC050263]|uniref:type VII secretion system-associated protein n=1 Tax=Streptomyces sp. NPDC050263 TaxID=3155037 RepID=UPI00342A1667